MGTKSPSHRAGANRRNAKKRREGRLNEAYKERQRALRNARNRRKRQLPGGSRTHDLRRYYKLTPEDFDRMLSEQNGRCAICGSGDTKTNGHMSVDHDHLTGKVRGLLCGSCNVGLGQFKDDPIRLAAAIKYLQYHMERSDPPLHAIQGEK